MERNNNSLSILIPVYNTVCVSFVTSLQKLADKADIDYEIIVGDDGSTDSYCIEQNKKIASLPNSKFIVRDKNAGSAAMRNFLAHESKNKWLLYIDSDFNIPNDNFLNNYIKILSDTTQVINGGICIGGESSQLQGNLRYLYEKAEEPHHNVSCRSQHPHHSFRSANFLIRRDIILACPFDERFKRSGYEDVLLGKHLKQKGFHITHINNPLLMSDYEQNADYLSKMERSLCTLYQFRHDLRGYSRLITISDGIHLGIVRNCITITFRMAAPLLRSILCSSHPNLTIFKLYKIGYYLSIKN